LLETQIYKGLVKNPLTNASYPSKTRVLAKNLTFTLNKYKP
jgi:hypothetical protein